MEKHLNLIKTVIYLTNHITLEDINTWNYLFGNNYQVLKLPANIAYGDETDLYEVTHQSGSSLGITLKIDPYKIYDENISDYRAFLYYLENDTFHIMKNRYQNSQILILTPNGTSDYYLFLDNNNFEIINGYPSGVLPKYFKYYFFDGDTGENRRYLLKTHMGTGVLVNETEYIQKDGDIKTVSLEMVVSDEKLSIDVGGTEIGVQFSDWKIPLYEPPLVEITDEFYIGCNNTISDVFSSPVDAEFYINNKSEENILIPEDTTKDSQLVNVVTTSEYPYLPLDTFFEVPINYYIVDDPNDFELKEYTVFNTQLRGITQELNDIKHTIDMNENRFRQSNLTINFETIIKNAVLMDNTIINNAELTITNGEFADNKIINNGTLIIDGCTGNKFNIINNGELIIKNSNFDLDETYNDLPFIHNTGSVLIQNNTIENGGVYENSSIIFIRGLDNVNDLIKDNTFNYDNCIYSEDGTVYTISGNGFIYSNIDDDSIILKELEVE